MENHDRWKGRWWLPLTKGWDGKWLLYYGKVMGGGKKTLCVVFQGNNSTIPTCLEQWKYCFFPKHFLGYSFTSPYKRLPLDEKSVI